MEISNTLYKEYEQKYLNRFVEDIVPYTSIKRYYKICKVKLMSNNYIQFSCFSYILISCSGIEIAEEFNKPTTIFSGKISDLDKAIKIIDKQKFKDILKETINKLIHNL